LDVIIELDDLPDDVSSDAVEEAIEEILEKKGIDPSDVEIDLCDLSDGFVTIEAEDSDQAKEIEEEFEEEDLIIDGETVETEIANECDIDDAI